MTAAAEVAPQWADQPERLYVDLGEILQNGPIERPVPTIFERTDGIGLLYEGKKNMVYGDAGSGKTHFALAAVKSVLDQGHRAAYIDMDGNGEAEILARLVEDQKADPEKVGSWEWFRYVEPELVDLEHKILPNLWTWGPRLVVVDSMTQLMAQSGKKSNLPDELTTVSQRFLDPLSRRGIASLTLDHVSKGSQGDDGPGGTGAKNAIITGVSLFLTPKQTFTRGQDNRAFIFLKKERGGGLGQHSVREEDKKMPRVADFVLRADGTTVLYPPNPEEQTPGGARPELLEKLKQHYEATGEIPGSWDEAAKLLGCRKQTAGTALKVFNSQFGALTQGSSQFPDRGTEPELPSSPRATAPATDPFENLT